MAEITRRRQGEIMRTVYQILLESGGEGLPPSEVIRRAQERLDLTDYERGEYPSSPGKPRFDKILRFSTIGHVKAGWLLKSRSDGWSLTEEGIEAYKQFPDPEEFQYQADKRYWEWERTRRESAQSSAEDIEEETAAATLEEAQDAAWAEVKAYVERMPPYEFQSLVAALLGAMGYHVAWIAPPGPDRGVDIIAFTDPLGAEGPRIKVQVKRQTTSKISVGEIRSFMATLSSYDVGLYISVSGYTEDAHVEARQQESRRIRLIDLEQLFDLWVQYYGRLSEEDRSLLPVRPVYFLAPDD